MLVQCVKKVTSYFNMLRKIVWLLLLCCISSKQIARAFHNIHKSISSHATRNSSWICIRYIDFFDYPFQNGPNNRPACPGWRGNSKKVCCNVMIKQIIQTFTRSHGFFSDKYTGERVLTLQDACFIESLLVTQCRTINLGFSQTNESFLISLHISNIILNLAERMRNNWKKFPD